MKTGIDKCNSTYAKKSNTLHRTIAELQNQLNKRKKYSQQASFFVKKLLEEGRISKEELREHFPRKTKNYVL